MIVDIQYRGGMWMLIGAASPGLALDNALPGDFS